MALKSALILSIKDEGTLIWEWVAHHLLCGFTDIFVFQNDSTDGSIESLKALHKAGVITYFDNTGPRLTANRMWKAHAYRKIAKLTEYQSCDYALALDADEFLCIKTPNGHLTEFLSIVQNAPEIRLNWRIFGSGGFAEFSDDLVTERFTAAQSADAIKSKPIGFKTLYQPEAFDHPAMHRPRPFSEEPIKQTNGSGLASDEFEISTRYKSNDPSGQKFAQLNHYILRDAQSYLLKLARGRPRNASFQPYAYWQDNDLNETQDNILANRAAALRAKMGELDSLTSGILSSQRQLAMDHQQKRVQALLLHPELKKIYDFCIGEKVEFDFKERLPIGKDWG